MRTPPAVPKRKFISTQQLNCNAQHNQTNQHERIMKFTQQPHQQATKQLLQRRASLNNDSRNEDEWLDKSNMQTRQPPVPLSQNYPTILPPATQRTRQAVRNQMSVDASKQLQNSSVLKSDTFRVQNGGIAVKSQPILNQQYNSKQLPVASTVGANITTQNTKAITKQSSVSSERVADTAAYPNILYNPTSNLQRKLKSSELSHNGGNIINRRKIIPPAPNESLPIVPPRKTSTETKIVSSAVEVSTNPSTNLESNSATLKHSENQNISKPEKPPPLMQVNTTNNIQKSPSSNKVSIRQDSSISSDSFSQTSSPSYTTKTMETPLLPHSTRYCNGKIGGNKQNSSLLTRNNAEAFDIEKDGKNNSTALTKSISTPASLQTIVRFHNGSNMSLHHRVSTASV